jgi:hypothetical protein
MKAESKGPSGRVIGPDGFVRTLVNLPSPNTKRWVARRKAEIVSAVRGGVISMADALKRYEISSEEFLNWDSAYKRSGVSGLNVGGNRHEPSNPK